MIISRRASALHLLDHILDEDSTTGESRSLFHQIQERVLSFPADHSHLIEIDDDLAPVEPQGCFFPTSFQLRDPGLNQFSFDYQSTLAERIDRRNLHHNNLLPRPADDSARCGQDNGLGDGLGLERSAACHRQAVAESDFPHRETALKIKNIKARAVPALRQIAVNDS